MSSNGVRPLADQPWLKSPASRQVLAALMADGRPARFVGGCVRDALLGREVIGRELDLATPEPPDRVVELLEGRGIRAVLTGIEHGTVTAIISGQRFEITTLRRDVTTDGRHAEVAFTDDFEVDAARRDFTINAMSCDSKGRLCDYFGGRADLDAGRVRFVGAPDRRIAEDYLRILRFFRFFAHYGKAPADRLALRACSAAAPEIARLSGERVQAEMLKLLAASDPVPTLALMAKAQVLDQVLPTPIALERLGRLIGLVPDTDPLLRLGALLRPPPASMGAAAVTALSWRLSRRDALRLERLTKDDPPPLQASAADRRRALYRLGASRYLDGLRLAAAEAAADAAGPLAEALALAREWRPPALPISGDDLLALGVPAGPRLGSTLRAVESWWEGQDFRPDREACLAHARELLAGPARSKEA
jgi:poly(A) polymerase